MFPTVAEILELPALQAGRPTVRAGRSGLERPVRWVHVSEQRDPSGTLASGVLVLSIGIPVGDLSVDPSTYLTVLRDAGAVALVIELGQHLRSLPSNWVQAARAMDYPLVELRRTVRFMEITEAVHARVVTEQYDRLKFADRVAGTFRGIAVDGVGVEQVVREAANLVQLPIVLEDAAHRVLALAGGNAEDVLRDWIARSRRTPTGTPAGGAGPEGWASVPVGRRGLRWGRLVAPARAEDDARIQMVLDHAGDAITLSELLNEESCGPVQEAHDRLLADLLTTPGGRHPEIQARLRALGFSEKGPFTVLALTPHRGEHAALCVAARTTPPPSVVGHLPDGIVVVLGDESTGRWDDVLDAIPDELAEAAATATASTVAALADAVAEAARVVRAASAGLDPKARRPWHAADLGARGLLWALRTDARLLIFVNEELAPILQLEERRRSDLLTDARAFTDADGVVAAFAEQIGVSRASAYARVNRLSDILGRNLRDPMTRFSLRVALLGLAMTRPLS